MTMVQFCEWCACVSCSAGNCCDHGKFMEDGRFNPRQPHRLAVRVVSGDQNAIGGNFIVEDEFGNLYRWSINEMENENYRGIPAMMLRRLQSEEKNIFDIYPIKSELVRAFPDSL
ncbi:hypothetical protein UFOVP570_32 [uncultured Caudovirales phage]|uniref:Uncharacterized protein n=1 Tax=uncultured Caudovirales phage TaxID=2100421 RepID=A0A6J5MZJ7_9CAUD|nr:hypothetical protein UFOVP570_32 [uncultured Caudovirales phage]